jgi:SAM-dependent methyltransferase
VAAGATAGVGTNDAELDEHVAENRRYWDSMAAEWVVAGERAWAQEPSWGIWGIPNDELPLLPDDLSGRDAIELGCGTGYVSAWMHRRGARVVAVDNSAEQLATARRLAGLHDVEIEWIHGNAEAVDRPDASFDFAISEYGAAIWCEPAAWLAEARRLLRDGGELVFLGHHPLTSACSPLDGSVPITDRLERPYFGLGRLDWRDAVDEPGGIEFALTMSDWMRRFRDTGFDIVDYAEVQAPPDASGTRFAVTAEWAKRFPSEHVWWLRAS